MKEPEKIKEDLPEDFKRCLEKHAEWKKAFYRACTPSLDKLRRPVTI